MPQIPSYQPQVQESVGPQVKVNENAPIEMFGGGAAFRETTNTAQALIKQSSDLFKEQKDQADDAWGMDFYAKAASKKNDLLYNPKSGALGLKGQDALPAGEVYGADYDKYLDGLIDSANNPVQRAQAQKIKGKLSAEFGETLQKHTFQESQVLKVQLSKAAMDAAAEDVKLNFQNPGKLQEGINLQQAIAYKLLDEQGIEGELANQQVHQMTSKTYTSVLDRMLTMGDANGASEMFKDLSAKKALTADDTENFSKTLRVAVLKNDALKASDQILDKHQNETSALAAVKEMFPDDADKQDETRRRVQQAFSDRNAALENQDRSNYRAALNILEKSKGTSELPVQLEAALRGSGKLDDLRKYAKNLQAGIEPPAQSSRFFQLQRMMVDQPQKFAALNIEQEKPKIASSEVTHFLDRQAAMKSGKGDDVTKGVRTTKQYIDQRLDSLGINPNPKEGTDDAKFVDKFWGQVDDEVEEFRSRTGKAPSADDRQKIVDKLSLKVTRPGQGFNLFSSTYWNAEKTISEIEFADIPDSQRTSIARQMKASGMAVNERMMIEIYRRSLIKGQK